MKKALSNSRQDLHFLLQQSHDTEKIIMKFAATAALFASMCAGASAFAPRQQVNTRAFAAKPLSMANVLKLSDPQSQLLDEVDVFIFDCDGVIWRVSISSGNVTFSRRHVRKNLTNRILVHFCVGRFLD